MFSRTPKPMGRRFLSLIALFVLAYSPVAFAQPADLPWDPDPDCNSIVTTGILSVTCGAVTNLPPGVTPYTFGLINMDGALPATGRIEVTNNQDMYHHPSWHVDSIGNVFGITLDNCGNIYTTASSNYSSDFFGSEAIIRYGEIGGGANDVDAAGTIYKIDGETGQASVFAVLPQQVYSFSNVTCEGFGNVNRNTGPGLGNLTFSYESYHFYVTNFEDGRIYRLDTLGTILDSYDPLGYDPGALGPPEIEEVAYGITINNDNTELFFGSCGNIFFGPEPALYSIPLNADGSFAGTIDNTNLPAGATWDNFVGTETEHTTFNFLGGGFAADTYYISDIEFAPNGNLLVGARVGCESTLHTSYNHGGHAAIYTEGAGGLYDALEAIVYISDGFFAENNGYGGVTVFENPNGNIEYIYSCGDLLEESGPHGVMIIEEGVYGTAANPASPAGAIAYIPNFIFEDPKGIGGDVMMFKECACEQTCPAEIVTAPISVCSDEPFGLAFNAQGGQGSTLDFTWTDADGNPVPDPDNVTITHTDCAPGTYPFYLNATCILDQGITYTDTLEVTVITDDLSPFLTILEQPCMVDVLIENGCEDFISIVGTIPAIMVGDSGSVSVDIVQTTLPACVSQNVVLEYNCQCAFEQTSLVEEDCENGEFFVTLNFVGNNTGQNFTVFDQAGNDLGTYSYTELPVTLGPFTGDFTTTYSLFIEDLDLPECASALTFGPTYCPPYGASWSADPPSCVGDFGTINFEEIEGGVPPYSYSIDGGQTFSSATIFNDLEPGVYQVVVQDGQGTWIEQEIVIPDVTPISLDLGVQAEVQLGESVQLTASTNLAANEIGSIQWIPAAGLSCANCLNPIATPSETTEYTVIITDLNGCVVEDRTTVVVNPIIALYIPNAFSPNGDGINDIFRLFPRDGSVETVEIFQVYDRWGELVWEYSDFDPNNPVHGWDGYFRGELMNSQVFAWYAIVHFVDGTTVLYEGDVTLVL